MQTFSSKHVALTLLVHHLDTCVFRCKL